jgi:phosphoribosylformylglycinamidine cyclo-ligase
MRKVFNLGIGYVFIVDPDEVHLIEGALSGSGESIVRIGRVVKCTSRA